MGFLSGLFGGGDSSSTSTSSPWGPQAGHLEDIFNHASDLFNQGSGQWQGDRVADLTPEQQQAIAGMLGHTTGMGQGITDALYGAGMGALGQWQGAADHANAQLAGGGYTASQNAGPNMELVGQLYNSDLVNSQIQSATQGIYDNLYQNQITGINSSAAGSGNLGSSRAGVAEAMARNGAAQMAGDVSSNIISSAYNNAVNQAGSVSAQNAELGQQNNQLNANNNQFYTGILGQIGSQAGSLLGQANDTQMGNLSGLLGAGSFEQNHNQNEINGQIAGENADWDLLNKYYGIVGGGNWGGTSTSTSSGSSSSPLWNLAGQALGGWASSGFGSLW